MIVEQIVAAMIEYSEGNLHDINHFMKVLGYARVIGKCEDLEEETQLVLEIAAIVHDIACPLCRIKYGNTNGKYQEKEGITLAKEFLQDKGLSDEIVERVAYLVGHHHTIAEVDGIDYQILLEADYLVNADESHYSKGNIEHILHMMFQTETGIRLLKTMYLDR